MAFHEISAERFTELIDTFDCFTPVAFEDLVRRVKRGLPTDGLFAITVDDAVGETVRSLCRVLTARSWPCTFYVPTSYIGGDGMPFQWWYRIATLLPRRELRVGDRTLDLSRAGAVRSLGLEMERLWRTRPRCEYWPLLMRLVEAVERDTGMSRSAFHPPESISWSEVRELSKNPLISFESHGTMHVAVSSMSESELRREMRLSRELIEEHTGRACAHFCYPFGSSDSIGPIAPRVARQYYESAVTMELGGVDGADRWLLPRIPLYEKNSAAVAMAKVGLKCSHLLNGFRTRGASPPTRVSTDSPERC